LALDLDVTEVIPSHDSGLDDGGEGKKG
jgi:hypothetical protein